jgi:acyl carrier protein
MSADNIQEVIICSLNEVAPNVDTAALDPDKSFRDQFDFDSIDQLNFVLSLQQALNIEIPELDYPHLAGLRATADYLSAQLVSTQ